jgi:PhnB protein
MTNGIIPYIQVSDTRAAAELYKKALGAEVVDMREMNGKIIHGHLRINGGSLFLTDPYPEFGHPLGKVTGVTLHLIVDNADAWAERAAAAGFKITLPVEQAFWGDRYGQLSDEFGIDWSVSTPPAK